MRTGHVVRVQVYTNGDTILDAFLSVNLVDNRCAPLTAYFLHGGLHGPAVQIWIATFSAYLHPANLRNEQPPVPDLDVFWNRKGWRLAVFGLKSWMLVIISDSLEESLPRVRLILERVPDDREGVL